jgi:two-component system, sensor histidine kinase and response regulator
MRRFFDDININFEQSLKMMFDLSPDGFLVSDLKGNILYISQAGKQMFQLDDSDIKKGLNFFDFVHKDYKEKAKKNNADRLNGNYNGFSEYKVVRKDGTIFWNETNAAFIRDSMGNPRSLFVVFRDISIRKTHEEVLQKYTESLQELNSLKDKFFSIIAHDLRNPFNGIMSFSNLLLAELKNQNIDKSIEYAAIIKDISNRGQALLTNLLDWARLQTGIIVVNKQTFSLKEMIDEQLDLIMPIVMEKSIDISENSDYKLTVNSDKYILGTIIRNILSNAVKYTDMKGKINISSSKIDDNLTIIIKDSGIGIDEDTRKKLFSLDFVYSTPGTSNEKGTGLGLILCKDLIKLLNGKIEVESKLGEGSKFTILLPI